MIDMQSIKCTGCKRFLGGTFTSGDFPSFYCAYCLNQLNDTLITLVRDLPPIPFMLSLAHIKGYVSSILKLDFSDHMVYSDEDEK